MEVRVREPHAGHGTLFVLVGIALSFCFMEEGLLHFLFANFNCQAKGTKKEASSVGVHAVEWCVRDLDFGPVHKTRDCSQYRAFTKLWVNARKVLLN